ncbi:LacI family DNA-binding transcriptional regulator [Palleronia salina]|uniref:LacI family DNA-binding transcriptional regulator n=1 Tax=Palleronia salina TaxID=313368 RepID=UPI0009330755|nr:LacI family DNA-binding transcriptional regulator [Palleronia salina]
MMDASKRAGVSRVTRRKTIYDIAELANASPSAVSAVLNGSWEKRRISRKTAERVKALAEAHGYSRNIQASVLRSARSKIIGMIIPKYDNRYFGAIAERFEATARNHGLFPVITCAQRDPELEAAAARELVSYQVETIIATGATDPDGITDICRAAGVRSLNLDLPGSAAPSIVSDNRGGARDLTLKLLDACHGTAPGQPLLFVGGRATDHNTAARIAGFRDGHADRGIEVPESNILACGYAGAKAYAALDAWTGDLPRGIFVNSTISLEGVIRWLGDRGALGADRTLFGCFDWDPFGALIPGNVGMARQDVNAMMDEVFRVLGSDQPEEKVTLIPCNITDAG